MTEILLIRHGETDWNAERRLQGHLDIPLNAQGLRQARALGRGLRDEPLDAIFASDLQRAQQTAQAIAAGRGMTVQTEAGLRERCYGAFEGLRYAEIGERYPQAHAAWQSRDIDARFPPGASAAETLREFSARALGTLAALAQSHQLHPLQRIAVVAHGGVLECLYRQVNGIGWAAARDFDIRNAGINRLSWDGAAFRIVQWSDVTHLAEAALDEVDQA